MGKFNMDSNLKEVIDDTRACEIVTKYAPKALKHPLIGMVYKIKIKDALKHGSMIGLTSEQSDSLLAEIMNLD